MCNAMIEITLTSHVFQIQFGFNETHAETIQNGARAGMMILTNSIFELAIRSLEILYDVNTNSTEKTKMERKER